MAEKKTDKALTQLSREVESKLDAPSEAEIRQVEDYIKGHDYYVLASQLPERDDHDQVTEIERVYFDTLNLSGYKAGIEIRVEHKARTVKDSKPYKMVVKIDAPDKIKTKTKGNALDRLEESYRMAGPQPDLSVISDKAVKEALKWAFGVKKLDDIDFYPLVRIMAQRSKYTYHPGGDKKLVVEFDRAVGKGHNFMGYSFDVFECELEIKKGDAVMLEAETDRLMKEFSFLAPNYHSKPTPGFAHLKLHLKNKPTRQFAQTHLQPDSFRVLNNIPS